MNKDRPAGEQAPQWRGGGRPYRGPGWRAICAEVRERDGNRCRRCGKTEAENGRALAVDHIVPFRLFESADEANDLSNLVSLCLVCHGFKTATIERRFVQRGDLVALEQFRRSVSEIWTEE